MRLARRLLLAAAILGGLFVGANVAAERIAEGRIAGAAQSELGTKQRPEASLDFPVLLDLLRGELPRVVLAGREAILDGLLAAEVRIVLEGVADPLGAITKRAPLRVRRGTVRAHVGETAVNAFLAAKNEGVILELREGDVVVKGRVGNCPVRAEGLPRLEKGSLVFRPARTPTTTCKTTPTEFVRESLREAVTFSVRLPRLPGGVAITRIQFAQGAAVFDAVISDASIDLV